MTINYQPIPTPLSKRLSEPSPHYNNMTAETAVNPLAQVQQRMIIILAFAIIAIILFAIFIMPRGFRSTPEAALTTNQPAQVAVAPAVTGIISPIFSPEVRHWEPQIAAWSQQYGIDANYIATIMQIESCGDPMAASGAGAQGLFQVMPFHFAAEENMLDPETNAQRGIAYFAERLAQTNGNVGLAFAGYNGGHVAAASGWDDWAPETQRYFTWATGIVGDIESGLTQSPTLQRWMEAGGASLCRQAANRLGLP